MEGIEKYISYDPSTGDFKWIGRVSKKHYVLNKVGTLNQQGYIQIRFKGKTYKAHRVAWYITYGVLPNGPLDHINRDKTDNRLMNLRETNPRDNYHNCDKFNGGVYFNKEHNKWRAQIQENNVRKLIGSYNTKEEAQEAYKKELINV